MSSNIFNDNVRRYIYNHYDNSSILLDVGPKDGKYSKILDDKYIIDCVEIWPEYITKYELYLYYRNVIYGDITNIDIDFGYYDLVVMGDVLEHIPLNEARTLVSKIRKKTNLIAVVPYNYPHKAIDGNKYQEHVQDNIDRQYMFDNYDGCRLLAEADAGQFISSLWVWDKV
jgi:2-polyprenyl-3-methyl-5-hydroxy-6-metoxy-1,4-benzoquinol methylase